MWLLASLLFLGAKVTVMTPRADLAFLLWPGMDLRAWHRAPAERQPLALRGITNLLIGSVLVWIVARQVPNVFAATWVCMIGFISALHGGVFTMLAAFWRERGRDVRPLLNNPLGTASLAEFWSQRWNVAFRDLAHRLVFRPVAVRFGGRAATWAVFLVSGLVHELVVTVPARGGYGGPTAYFLIQALGIALERRCTCARGGLVWRVRALALLTLPLPIAFPPVFVGRVAAPFFTFLHAL